MAAFGILLVKARYMAIAVTFEASLYLYGGIMGFVDKDLRFLQKAISI